MTECKYRVYDVNYTKPICQNKFGDCFFDIECDNCVDDGDVE